MKGNKASNMKSKRHFQALVYIQKKLTIFNVYMIFLPIAYDVSVEPTDEGRVSALRRKPSGFGAVRTFTSSLPDKQ